MEWGVLQGRPDEFLVFESGLKTTTILPFLETGDYSVASKKPSGVFEETAFPWSADLGVRPPGLTP